MIKLSMDRQLGFSGPSLVFLGVVLRAVQDILRRLDSGYSPVKTTPQAPYRVTAEDGTPAQQRQALDLFVATLCANFQVESMLTNPYIVESNLRYITPYKDGAQGAPLQDAPPTYTYMSAYWRSRLNFSTAQQSTKALAWRNIGLSVYYPPK